MTDKEAREAAYEAFGGIISPVWASASKWEREEVRRSVDAAIDAYLTMSGYVRKPSREELIEVLFWASREWNELGGAGWPDSRAKLQADAILALLERTDR